MKTVRVLIGGMGNAARPMVDLITSERARMAQEYDLAFQIVGVTDSKGAAIGEEGIPSETVSEAKSILGTVSKIPHLGRPGMSTLEMIERCSADIYVDGLPPYLPDGEPGASNIQLAGEKSLQLRYGTAASSGLPTLEMGRALGHCGELLEFGGIFNASCMYVIDCMKKGQSFDSALEGARAGGFLEPNPAMDIDGWDTAMKTVIQANTYWDACCTLAHGGARRAGGREPEALGKAGMPDGGPPPGKGPLV